MFKRLIFKYSENDTVRISQTKCYFLHFEAIVPYFLCNFAPLNFSYEERLMFGNILRQVKIAAIPIKTIL